MDKINVEICCGTACYLLGAAKLMNLENELPESWSAHVEIQPRTCLSLCERENLGSAPFVRFNGSEIMSQATPEKVMVRIQELIEGVG